MMYNKCVNTNYGTGYIPETKCAESREVGHLAVVKGGRHFTEKVLKN